MIMDAEISVMSFLLSYESQVNQVNAYLELGEAGSSTPWKLSPPPQQQQQQ